MPSFSGGVDNQLRVAQIPEPGAYSLANEGVRLLDQQQGQIMIQTYLFAETTGGCLAVVEDRLLQFVRLMLPRSYGQEVDARAGRTTQDFAFLDALHHSIGCTRVWRAPMAPHAGGRTPG